MRTAWKLSQEAPHHWYSCQGDVGSEGKIHVLYTWRSHLGEVTSRVTQGHSERETHVHIHLEATPGGGGHIQGHIGVTQRGKHMLCTPRGHTWGGHVQGHTGVTQGNLCSVHLQVTPGGGGTSRVTPGSQQTAAGVQISISVKEEGCLHGVPGSLVPGCSHIPKSADAQFPHTKWVTSASALCTPSLA